MSDIAIKILYMVSCIFFIRGIKLLGKTDTARKGNAYSAVGMLIACVTVLIQKDVMSAFASDAGAWGGNPLLANGYCWIIVAVLIGTIIGAIWSKKVQMTGMPELVALFNGFGGLSSLLVALTQYIAAEKGDYFTAVSLGLTIAIGAVAFTGSLVAWGKLSGKMTFKGWVIPAKNAVNGVLCVLGLVSIIAYAFLTSDNPLGCAEIEKYAIIASTAIFLLLGFTMVIPIGGGDMPVIISFLNALSGLAAAFAGFAINNTVLVVSGCLVGASGLILTLIMCKAMNRTFGSLLFKSFGGQKKKGANGPAKEPKSMSVEDAYMILEAAKNVVFVPGYGMAVAQAQHAVKELCDKLEENGAEVNFAIHPVAGRMPGHMNVLLAEANVPYEQLKTADEMNPQMSNVDVAIVIGANDVVNPDAINDESSPLYGMPIVNAHEARTVFVLKRGKGTGFSGVENPLFTNDNTVMIYGDAKATVSALVSEFNE
ncbi:NAD(P)(+) transhydrogenase (Re/Si-specific) subunit beta [Treponema ruminis]|uniref:NAD(P) transhydrogenase subunit beta n=1 Tax=Treponema ruminis TaxID=744515 RepID=A0A7W8G720_9SPIR|nr:NAD(P)(+) transhydrogenase (Re/Si-specific) subunit beta [Treponema ruminis]MBB5225068.1 NAD(P) transhydrogenase subunit beta [Treponema ruminis]QSI00988.1 NAD(P)(+) transhydrogenase (Re/Si-specific) subunit beta [Treponema ruminis]